MWKILTSLSFILVSQALYANNYNSTYQTLIQQKDSDKALTALNSIEDPTDFVLSLTVGQIMLIPSENQLLLMQSVPAHILEQLFSRDGVNLVQNLTEIDYSDSKTITLSENYFIIYLRNAVEDIMIASESEWDSQVMSFRGSKIRQKYVFYSGNLFEDSVNKIINLFYYLEISGVPLTAKFTLALENVLKNLQSNNIFSMFKYSESVNMYPGFVESYIAYLQSVVILVSSGDFVDPESNINLVSVVKEISKAPLSKMKVFLESLVDQKFISDVMFDDPRQFSDLDKQNEWDWITGSISFVQNNGDYNHYVGSNYIDDRRIIYEEGFVDARAMQSHALADFSRDILTSWSDDDLEYWEDELNEYLDRQRPVEPYDSSCAGTADVLEHLSKMSAKNFEVPKKIKFDTVKASNIVIFEHSDESLSVFYPEDLDAAAVDYIRKHALDIGYLPVGLSSFKRMLQAGLAKEIVTQGAFKMQKSNPLKTFYAATFEANGMDWSSDSDRVQLFGLSHWEVFLQPVVNQNRSMLIVNNDSQWLASKEKAEQISSDLGIEASQVPFIRVIDVMNHAIKSESLRGVYMQGMGEMEVAKDNQAMIQTENTDCLSLFKKRNL